MRKLLLIAGLLLLPLVAGAAPLSSPCTQAAAGAAECDPVNSGNPLPVTGGITTGLPGTPAAATTGPNVVTIQGVAGGTPVPVISGQCPPNAISKIASPWPFCK